MASKIAIINIGLALLFGFFSVKTYQVWTTETAPMQHALKNATAKGGDGSATANPRTRFPSITSGSKKKYRTIAEKNLFSMERAEEKPVETVVEAVVKADDFRIEGKKIELYGVVITEEKSLALISDPDIKNRARPTRWVKSGDRIGQFKVDAISKEDIIFSEGSEKFKVVLWDQQKNRVRSAAPIQEKPAVAASQRSPTKRSKPDTLSVESAKEPKKATASDDEYVIIQTPFGDVKRKK